MGGLLILTTHFVGVFWVNIAKYELYFSYRNRWKLFRIVRKESEFQYHHCRNSTKSMREKKKKRGERKCSVSVMWIPKFFCPLPAARVWSVRGVRKVKRKKKLWQLWQYHRRKWEEKKIMVVEIWEGIKKKKCYVHNIFTTSSQQIIGD